MSAGFDDAPECHRTVYRRACKEHDCYGCTRTITAGERYRVDSGVWDGDPSQYKYCAACSLLIDAICGTPGNEGFVHGFMCGHSWEEVFGEEPPERVARLAFVTVEEAQKLLEDET